MIDRILDAEVVIVDFDRTLVTLETDWGALRQELSDYCREKLNANESFENIDAGLFEIRCQLGEHSFKKLLEIVSHRELKGYSGRYIEKTVELLLKLPEKKKIAIFSSNCRKTIESILPLLPVRFDIIVAKEDVRQPKPSGEGIRKILKHFNVKAKDAFFIGDSENDIKSGNEAGVKTILVESLNV